MNPERWRSVVGYEEMYEISSLGRARGVDRIDSAGRRWRGRVLSPQPAGAGYLYFNLSHAGKTRRRAASRAILESFVGPCPENMEACHNNGVKLDNSVGNLRWDTKKGNEKDKAIHGTRIVGELHKNSKLNSTNVERINDLHRAGYSQDGIGEWLSIGRSAVRKVVTGKTWKHVAVQECPTRRYAPARLVAYRNSQAKLSDGDIERIRDMRQCGALMEPIANWFSISRTSISRVCSRP